MVLPSVVMDPTRAEVVMAEEVLPEDWAPELMEPDSDGLPRTPRADEAAAAPAEVADA